MHCLCKVAGGRLKKINKKKTAFRAVGKDAKLAKERW